jgi:predicted nucleotidyltransferase
VEVTSVDYQAKDFIETEQGLLFAVVADGREQGRVLCFLRYAYLGRQWQKLATNNANAYLQRAFPDFLYYSPLLDTHLHAVDEDQIVRHYQPKAVLQQLLQEETDDPAIMDLQALCGLLQANHLDIDEFGVTGSLLVGMQDRNSDIDLVCYDRATFHQARNIIQALIAKDRCQALNDTDWLSAYRRRACDFALDDYIWHEERKYNKAIFNQRKFDLSLLANPPVENERRFQKLGFVHIQTSVVDDHYGYDYPAEFTIDHPEIASVVCFTATYVGQAKTGEQIAVAGQLEVDDEGRRRIVVGSNREAIGEYIRVIR